MGHNNVNPNWRLLPASMAAVLDIAGPKFLQAMIERYGGVRVTVPTVDRRNWLTDLLADPDAVQGVIKCLGGSGQRLDIPLCKEWLVLELEAEGLSASAIARKARYVGAACSQIESGSSRGIGGGDAMTTLSALISLNAERPLADGKAWVHLLPAGRFNGIDGRGPYDASDLEGIVLASRDYAGRREMVVDYNHATEAAAQNGGDAPAAGWIVGLQARTDGIWGLVEWTAATAARLDAREYRYLSPVFHHDAKGRIDRILRASLTNIPNLDQLTALASAEDNHMDELLTKLRSLLVLPVETGETEIVAALTERLTASHSAAEPDPAKYVPIGHLQRAVAETNKLRQGISKQAAEEKVDEVIRKGIVLPFLRDWAIALCTSNAPAFDDFVHGVGPGFSHLLASTHASQRSPAKDSGTPEPMEAEVARNMGLDPTKFAAFRAAQEH